MKLVDTSCWIHALRKKGDPAVRERVRALLDTNSAAWCQLVRLELWRGAENEWDRELLSYLEANVTMLAISSDVWQRSVHFTHTLRREGKTVPTTDLIIFACAAVHGVEIEHADKHFDLLNELFPQGI
jgi:predicted nucleic acid-binding protein